MPAYTHVVRYHETDAQGHVYHARYFEIADVAFSDYLAALAGRSYSEIVARGCDPAVVSVHVDFTAPASYEALLDVDIEPVRVGTTSFTLNIRIVERTSSKPVATLTTTYVNFDVRTAQARPLPSDIADRLRAHITNSKEPRNSHR